MTSSCASRFVVLSLAAALLSVAPLAACAQDERLDEPKSPALWSRIKEGKLSFNARYRFEAFERDGAPFTAPAYAPTLRLALGYETPSFHGLTAFAQGGAVIVTGSADYSVPALPSQNRPDRPAILDPKSVALTQWNLKWAHRISQKRLEITVGRQETTLNDGRFLSISNWRQLHGAFDVARVDAELSSNFSFTYAFVNRFYREDGYHASDGQQPMHSHVWNLVWSRTDRIKVALYGLLLDFHTPALFANSTQTYGLRASGPYRFNQDWSLIYNAEYAKQKNYAANPNRVDANYFLGEVGPGWRGLGLKVGQAFLAGHSPTDLLTTPLAPPFNGWTDLFINDPSGMRGSGLEARYVYASGPVRFLGGALGTIIFYDYHSDVFHVHYGSELDSALAYKVKRVSDHWEIGWRFGRYWADRLFTNAVRTSIYTSFTL